ncbi:MAG TPA: hypothetical protein VM328_05210 [Fimbriimonadaceae bacterium]|nr:hypothetical protein [Fimbriimonadaceae bacterium]
MPKKLIFLAPALLFICGGCDGKKHETLIPQVVAFDTNRSSLAVAFGTVSEEAEKLTHRSSQEALAGARRAAVELQSKLADLELPSELDQLRLAALRRQVERLDAAILVHSIRQQWEAALKGAAAGREGLAAKRAELRQRDPAFKALDEKLLKAESAYKDAANQLAAVLKAIEEAKKSTKAPS